MSGNQIQDDISHGLEKGAENTISGVLNFLGMNDIASAMKGGIFDMGAKGAMSCLEQNFPKAADILPHGHV